MAEQQETSTPAPQQSASTQKSPHDFLKESPVFLVPTFSGFPAFPHGDFQMVPIMYPALVPGLNPLQNQEQLNHGAGIYAVPVLPYMGPTAGLSSNTLIPLTYNIPTSSPEAGSGEAGQGQQQQQQQQQAAPQRQVVVRRFRIAFQLDLLLILKLAAVIFLFNQDGSRQRLIVLVLFALLVYLYQTGALTPLIRWLSQSMQRAAAPPPHQRPAVRAENAPAAGRVVNENAPLAEGQAGAENDHRPIGDGNQAVENGNEDVAEPGVVNGGHRWWGIVKEIQMIVFGFITSLLPGFHNID
ncbi:uncharacterized protein LOC119992482 isoform X2 [Tripterygium wilfordii]|uniref:uncharacterized protein LOC119992482 isoform X2 n=1 Tax=Tripterygium wilfordii TaxID=458696 RepID=UPI0018F81D1B|nr:uncharacterized protein LOC119992482 isoform X2 [Tripterygium wilfordii]